MKSKNKQIGFFGGSFDPIHHGHLNLAIEMLEKGGLDEILFCPANCSPFKVDSPPSVKGMHRLEMIRRVIQGIPGMKVTSIEVESSGPSYTIDTLRKLKKTGVQYRLILSDEAAVSFHLWKEADALALLAPPLVGSRGKVHISQFETLQTSIFEVSSTVIRDRFKKGLYCGHLVPTLALDYIADHRIYS